MADLGTLSVELQGKLGLEASKNLIFQKLTSKIGPNSNFATFTEESKIPNCHKNWLVIGMKLKFSGNAYLIDSNKWWKFQRNWRTFIDSLRWPWLEWPMFTFSASLFQLQNYYLTDSYYSCTQDFLSRPTCVGARLLERKFFMAVTSKSCICSKHFEKRKYIYSCWWQIRNTVPVSLYCKLLILCSFLKKRLGAHTGGTV